MFARVTLWLAALFNPLAIARRQSIVRLPVFYAVVEAPGYGNQVHETTKSIHRARGICREMTALGKHVALATYTAESITEEF